MVKAGKIQRLCRTLLLAASMVALSAGAAAAQQGDALSDLNERILENPQDVGLNLEYARAAEAAGRPRLALVAYERILINDPSNAEARRGYERIRREIEPGYTVTRVEVGARWDSNALNTNEELFTFTDEDTEATTYFGKLMIANEQQGLFDRRWRSILNMEIEETPDAEDLNYGYIGAQTGPILYVGPHLAALPAIGVGMSWLGGEEYFREAHVSLTVEGRTDTTSYWWRLRGGYREYDNDPNDFFSTITENGVYAEARAGITRPRLFSERDTLLVQPFVRWSDIEGSTFNFWIFDNFAPGEYLEYGVDVNYNYQLSDHFEASIGVLARERDFRNSIREDSYVAPQASLTLEGALPCSCDVRLQYRYRDSDSNDFTADYTADQVTLSLLARF